MKSTSAQMRAWSGPALLSFGFRPFFLGAALWATLSMLLWMLMLSGNLSLPTSLDPVSWHAHEFLFGYLGAVVAGFLLTAVPNWTGRLPIVGWRLGGLAALWGLGRLVITFSDWVAYGLVAVLDLAFPLALAVYLTREIIVGHNWRNLIVIALLGVFILANALFHLEFSQGRDAVRGTGLRLGVGTAMMMIAVIGGRIVPSFTRNWLVRRASSRLPVPPMQGFDKVALIALLTGLLCWVVMTDWKLTGLALIAGGTLHIVRLSRWSGHLTLAEPLVAVLHLGYAFLPIGALALGLSILFPAEGNQAAIQHIWMSGAVGLMTLAVMTRATLGHTGQDMHAGLGTSLIYLALILAVVMRVMSGFAMQYDTAFRTLSGLFWIVAFGGFAVLYGPLLLSRRRSS